MPSFEIRPAGSSDMPRLMAMDHSCFSDYVWQLELRRDAGQITSSFREVRLPRSVVVAYPRDPLTLANEWARRDGLLVAIEEGLPVGYVGVVTAAQAWAADRGARRLILEMQSKNQPCIRLAQKFGYDFCGYNDQYYPTQDVALFFGRALQ
jgi:hypothetical protein